MRPGTTCPSTKRHINAGRAPSSPIVAALARLVCKLFSGTLCSGTPYSCRIRVLFWRGIVQGLPTKLLADEVGDDDSTSLAGRPRRQAPALAEQPAKARADCTAETDELFRHAGEKGPPHAQASDPPRPRAKPREGRGTIHHDRAPVVGGVGRI